MAQLKAPAYVIRYDVAYNAKHNTRPFWNAALRHRGPHAKAIQTLAAGGKIVVGSTAHHLRDLWYHAASSGERVTLASLYRAGALKRRAWRGNEGEADAAYEYRLTPRADMVLRETLAKAAP